MKSLFLALLGSVALLLMVSCKKEASSFLADEAIIGQWGWSVQYTGSPLYTLTPQNTGINETLVFYEDRNWIIVQNSVIVKSGTYKTSRVTKSNGEQVNAIHYNNSNLDTDSTTYYKIYNDSLIFSNDFGGTVGSGARIYIK